ncbi:GntR family transcriptional regulator [Brucella pseudogrignonensis]|uniref:GntR family transcriptional regulator n=1 Tax=Brucella pseudogrignonensis TaxID=419475 RepID=UPI003ECF356E
MATGDGPQLLREQAYNRIKSELLKSSGDLALSERQLASDLGLSLAPVRAALERLRVENLIVVTRNAGIQLPQLTVDEILDFYEVRSVFEGHIVEGLAARDLRDQGAHIEDILEQQTECVAKGEVDNYHELDMQFHLALASLYGNAEMVRVLAGLRDRMHRLSTRIHTGHPERLAANCAQHCEIFAAIRSGDAQAARRLLIGHLNGGRDFIMTPGSRSGPRLAVSI